MSQQDWWLPRLRPELEQGDIIQTNLFYQLVVPVKHLKPGKTAKSNAKTWEETESPIINDIKPRILANTSGEYGIILSYGCEIEKAKDQHNILIAPVAPLSVFDPNLQDLILKQKAYKYLPIVDLPGIAPSYANLSKTFSLQKKQVELPSRIKSMTDEGITRVKAQLIAFYTRLEIPQS